MDISGKMIKEIDFVNLSIPRSYKAHSSHLPHEKLNEFPWEAQQGSSGVETGTLVCRTQDLTLSLCSVLCLWLESYRTSSVVLRPETGKGGQAFFSRRVGMKWKKTQRNERKKQGNPTGSHSS